MNNIGYIAAACVATACLLCLRCGTTPEEYQDMHDPKAAIHQAKPGPRPVTLATCTIEPWAMDRTGKERIPQVMAVIDSMAASARKKGTQLDMVLLPEHIMHTGDRRQVAEPLSGGPVLDACAAKCREYDTNMGVPVWLREGDDIFNALVILDRRGAPAGVYKKVYPVLHDDGSLESGIAPGDAFPVFDLDFGRVGAQICFDEFYHAGWDALGGKGAELVLFSSASSGVSVLKSQAWRNHYYVLASTFRVPTVIVDPIGGEVARTEKNMQVLVETVDLDYRIVPWNALKDFGQNLGKKYKGRIRQDWHLEEDLCILTSLDPALPVQKVMDDEKLFTRQEFAVRCAVKQGEMRGKPIDK